MCAKGICGVGTITTNEREIMPTDKQAKQAAIGAANWATKQADAKWQLVVNHLKKIIAELEEQLEKERAK